MKASRYLASLVILIASACGSSDGGGASAGLADPAATDGGGSSDAAPTDGSSHEGGIPCGSHSCSAGQFCCDANCGLCANVGALCGQCPGGGGG